MEDGDNQRRSITLRQAKDVMMTAMRNAQPRMERIHFLEYALAERNLVNACFQSGNITAYLRFAPLLARMADNRAQIGVGLAGQDVIQPRPPSVAASSSSRMSAMD